MRSRSPLRLVRRPRFACLLLGLFCIGAFMSACTANRPHASHLQTSRTSLSYDAHRDRIIAFGPTGGPNLLCVRELDTLPPADGSYTFFGGMYSWISPQGAWTDENGEPRDWPPDPAMDRGPATVVHHGRARLVAVGPPTRAGLVEQKWFELAGDRAGAVLDHRLHNPTDERRLGGIWINTAVKPGSVIAVRDGSSDSFRIAGGDTSNALWARATTARDGWLLIHTEGVEWSDLGADWFKFFADTAPAIAIWTDGYWLLRQARYSPTDRSLTSYGEAPVEVYINYGLQIFEAELLGPIASIPSGGVAQHVERWMIVPAAEPDPTVLDAIRSQ